MKKTLINEIVAPLVEWENSVRPKLTSYDRSKFGLLLNKVRADLNSLFDDMFDPTDSYFDENFAGADDDFSALADKNCGYCNGSGRVAVPFGEDDFEYEICRCTEVN